MEAGSLVAENALTMNRGSMIADIDRVSRQRLSMGTLRCLFHMAPAVLADRKSTRLNSSHRCISYAVFCLKTRTLDGKLALGTQAGGGIGGGRAEAFVT